MKQHIIAGLVLLLVCIGSGPAQDNMEREGRMRFGLHLVENNLFEARFLLRFRQDIGLSEEQVEKIEHMMLAWEENAMQRNGEIKTMELKFTALLRDAKVDRKQMEKIFRELARLRNDLQLDHINYLLDLRALLSPEQIRRIEQKKQEIRRMARERMMGGGSEPHRREGGRFFQQ